MCHKSVYLGTITSFLKETCLDITVKMILSHPFYLILCIILYPCFCLGILPVLVHLGNQLVGSEVCLISKYMYSVSLGP